jgi:flavin-dependent dehydrogenase
LKTDVFIVGGGPAGLATAIAVRQQGLHVVVADPAQPPIDKACGEGLMPNSVAALADLGVTLESGQAMPFRGIRFIDAGITVEGAFPQGHGIGIRRTTLHGVLVERAAAVGADFLWRTRVTRVNRGEVLLGSRKIESRWIIGADGQNSRVRKWAGLDDGKARHIRYGFRQHFRVFPWSDFVEVHWGRNCQIVVTPVRSTEVCLVVTSSSAQLRLQDALKQFPEIARKLEGNPVITKDLGAVSALRVVRTVCRDPFGLVGDASGSVDPLTGEGLGLAFQQARALSKAIANHDLASYQSAHQRINRGPVIMSRVLLALAGNRWLRHRAFRALAHEPQLFTRLLAAHVGTFSPRGFGLGDFLRLGGRLLASPS